uniref:Uncharacterized protein n=1 Tax=Cucumis sativus TaxID=3659 RepID=A0A0A0K4H3_CUCSA
MGLRSNPTATLSLLLFSSSFFFPLFASVQVYSAEVEKDDLDGPKDLGRCSKFSFLYIVNRTNYCLLRYTLELSIPSTTCLCMKIKKTNCNAGGTVRKMVMILQGGAGFVFGELEEGQLTWEGRKNAPANSNEKEVPEDLRRPETGGLGIVGVEEE